MSNLGFELPKVQGESAWDLIQSIDAPTVGEGDEEWCTRWGPAGHLGKQATGMPGRGYTTGSIEKRARGAIDGPRDRSARSTAAQPTTESSVRRNGLASFSTLRAIN